MEITKRQKILLILVIIIILVIFVVFKIVSDRNNNFVNSGLNGEYKFIYKKYGVNEYSTVSISDEQLANIYLNNFKYYLFNDTEYAYNLLDESYSNSKFGTIDKFKEYIDSISYSDLLVEEYSISGNKDFIEIHTLNDEKYIFKITGVLDYKVYLDDYTVEILVK